MNNHTYTDLNPSPRTLLGPGPSMVAPRVLQAMSMPLVGHLDPEFLAMMNDVQEMLRYVFQTSNELTIPISGTGSAGMEAAMCNFIEPGDNVLIGVNGYFGERMCNMAGRYGANVDRIERPWGEIFDPEEVEARLRERKLQAARAGPRRDLDRRDAAARARDGRCGAPPRRAACAGHRHLARRHAGGDRQLGRRRGIQRHAEVPLLPARTGPDHHRPRGRARCCAIARTRSRNWYLDLTMVEKYWGNERTYHHTAPISMNYAPARGAAAGGRRGPREARSPATGERATAVGRPRGAGPAPARAGREPPALFDHCRVLPPGMDDADRAHAASSTNTTSRSPVDSAR